MIDFPGKTHYDAEDYRRLVELLRSEQGCPWDRAQTHRSLRRFLLEESSELCEAIDEDDPAHMREELGDVWLQILLHADIEREAGHFDLDDVADTACRKMIRRHPHVFGGDTSVTWEEIKREEKHQTSTADAMDSVCRTLPGLWRAEKVQKKAASAGFDWSDIRAPLSKIREETEELSQAIENNDRENMEEELGDLLFAAVNVARHLGIDPEKAVHSTSEKYIRRFRFMENAASEEGKVFDALPEEEMLRLYQRARWELEGKSPPAHPFN